MEITFQKQKEELLENVDFEFHKNQNPMLYKLHGFITQAQTQLHLNTILIQFAVEIANMQKDTMDELIKSKSLEAPAHMLG